MTEALQMLVTILIIALATFATRFLPFLCFGSREPPAMLSTIEQNLPPMILLLLVIYCMKDVQWLSAPYGVPERFHYRGCCRATFLEKECNAQYLCRHRTLHGTCSIQCLFFPLNFFK